MSLSYYGILYLFSGFESLDSICKAIYIVDIDLCKVQLPLI